MDNTTDFDTDPNPALDLPTLGTNLFSDHDLVLFFFKGIMFKRTKWYGSVSATLKEPQREGLLYPQGVLIDAPKKGSFAFIVLLALLLFYVWFTSNRWLNDSPCARVYENSTPESKKSAQSKAFHIWVINKRNLGLYNTILGRTYVNGIAAEIRISFNYLLN